MCQLILLTLLVATTLVASIPSGRIIGGHDTDIEEVPWQVSLMFYGAHYCGGSIINENTVISAAHCLFDVEAIEIMVRGGSTIQWKGGFAGHVKKIIVHPEFDPKTNNNDVGLVQIEGKFEFSEKLQPVQLPQQGEQLPVGANGVISGWGLLYSDGPSPKLLQSAEVPILEREVCEKIHKDRLKASMFCAGPLEGGRDTCQEDSGGPIVVGNTLVGVSSWGVGCGRPNFPGVYTNVAQFRSWVDSVLEK